MRPQRTGLLFLVASAALVVAAIAGGAVALTGAALIWGIGTSSSAAPAQPVSTGDAALTTARFRRMGQPLTIGQIYQRARPGVVRVSTETVVRSTRPVRRLSDDGPEAARARFRLRDRQVRLHRHEQPRGPGAERISVSFSNNESMAARLVGRDPSTDVAVLKVSAESRALRPLELGDSDGVRVGDAVVAIGNPLGYERTVTSGIVSATGRAIQAPNQSLIDQVIQTDAAINQGNSGGPLLNSGGRVIGVNTQIAAANGGNVGLGFAIPVNTVKNVASQIIDKGRVEHAQLGIYAQAVDARTARVFHLPASAGLLVADVDPGSGAARAGIRAGTQHVTVDGETYVMGGDLVVAADGRPMHTVEALREVVSAKSPGDAIRLVLYRGTTTHTVRVKLGRQPSSPRG